MGKLDEALKDFDAAIKINPESSEAYQNRAITKMQLQDTLSAHEDNAKAERLRMTKREPKY